MPGIYAIVNTLNWRRYIGSSVKLEARFGQHRRELARGVHHNLPLQRAWNKYGPTAFDFVVLEHCDTSQLLEREQHYLNEIGDVAYNVALVVAAPMLGRHHLTSEETRAKIGAAHRGRTRSLAQREHLRQLNTGKRLSPETREKIGAAHRGKKHGPRSVQARANIKAASRPPSIEDCRRGGAWHKGRKQSAEWIAKRAATWIGRAHSEESRSKMRASRAAYLARKKEAA